MLILERKERLFFSAFVTEREVSGAHSLVKVERMLSSGPTRVPTTGKFPDCMEYMPKWKNKYGIQGKLRIEIWKKVVEVLETSTAKKKGVNKEKRGKELQCARVWLRASQEKEQIQMLKSKEGEK